MVGFVFTSSCLFLMLFPVLSADPEVATTTGRIRGFERQMNGKTVDVYLGVPFAEPPIKDLRFKRPKPIKKWNTTLDTKNHTSACYQMPLKTFSGRSEEVGENMWNPSTNMSEDCLHLNIWVPKIRKNGKLPTMIWIYGGGFITGTTALKVYDGSTLASIQEVIVVSISYRLGIFGFLYLEDELAPGNMGLLDQYIGIKWIYDNIDRFGGSRSSITLFGESAGAASVNYHMMSPLTNKYFQRGILQSASFLANWAYQPPKIAKQYAFDLADKIGCKRSRNTDIISCLKTVDAQKLTDYQWRLPYTYYTWPFAPTIDGYFIDKSPLSYMEEGNFTRKEFLVGVNLNEGSYYLLYELFNSSTYPRYIVTEDDFIRHIPKIASKSGKNLINAESERIVIDAILQEYASEYWPGQRKDFLNIMDRIGGDSAFTCPVLNFALMYNRAFRGTQAIYMYLFKHRSSSNPWPSWAGVMHGDEIEYVFGIPTQDTNSYTVEETILSQEMMKYWTNFAKLGNPEDENSRFSYNAWPKYTTQMEEYAVLKAGKALEIKYGLKHRQCSFWRDFLPKLQSAIDDGRPTTQPEYMCVNIGNLLTYNIVLHICTMLVGLVIFNVR